MANTLSDDLDNPFWQFSLKIYQHEKVKEACLSFQNQEGINVNLLLLCCWLAYGVEEISQFEFHQACSRITAWQQQVTHPLRQIRQYLKTTQEAHWVKNFYQHVLVDEISSEAYQQFILYNCFANKQKNKCSMSVPSMLSYLGWLFENTKNISNNNLKLKIHTFAHLIEDIVE